MKKILSLILSLSMIFAFVVPVSAETGIGATDLELELLQELEILSGYEDGSLRLEDTISRAEATKMIVAMVNKTAAAENQKGKTKFADVPADAWYSGFVNVGVTDKFINGKSANEFKPNDNVKYNEIVKMIVSCLGYEEYAQFYGGYPNGYIAIADSEGISDGCEMNGESAATRGIVCKLILNALNTPIVKSNGMQYSSIEGKYIPKIEKQDAIESKHFKTLLTEKFDAYLVEGRVTGTYKSGTTTELDEVSFTVDKMENYDQDVLIKGVSTIVNIGNTNADEYLETYAEAIIKVDAANRKTLIGFIPSNKNTSVMLDITLFDDEEGISDSIYFYPADGSSKSVKYKLEKDYNLFVNGIKTDSADITSYIAKDKVGTVEFIDTFKSAEGYDIINVEFFETVKVTATSAKKIYFNKTDIDGKTNALNLSSISIDEESLEDIELNVYINGEEVAPSEIVKDDILSIKFDVAAKDKSKFFDVYVSRNTDEGTFKALDTEEKVATIGTKIYTFVDWDIAQTEFNKANLSNEYKVYLDVFDRVYSWERTHSSGRYAIVDKYQPATNSSTYDNDRIRLWTTDGKYRYVEIADSAKINVDNIKDRMSLDVTNRVVSYKISSSTGKITSLEFIDGTKVENDYDARNEKIGSVIVTSATTFIDVEEYLTTKNIDDIEVASIDSLIDDVDYTVYRYGKQSLVDNSYPLVLITKGEADYTEDTLFAVVTKPLGAATADDETVLDTLTVLYEGEEQVLYVDEDYTCPDVKINDVIILKKNASNKVKEVVKVFDGTTITTPNKYFTTMWNPADDDLTKLIYAPIVTRNGRNYFAQIDSNNKTYIDKEATQDATTADGATLDILTNDDTIVYVYDCNAAKNEKFYVGSTGDIVGSATDHIITNPDKNNDYYTINWNDIEDNDQVNYAFAKIVDDIALEIFVIIGENN